MTVTTGFVLYRCFKDWLWLYAAGNVAGNLYNSHKDKLNKSQEL